MFVSVVKLYQFISAKGMNILKIYNRTVKLVALILAIALLGGCAVVVWLLPILVWLLPAVCCLAMSYLIEPVFKAQTENKEDGNDDPWYNE